MADAPLLALALLMKDEARSAAAVVASARPACDAVALLDTGSTDDTPDLVRAAAGDLPVVAATEPFVDFAASRNRSLDLAAATGATFALWLSGDETLTDPAALRSFCAQVRDEGGPGHDAYNVPVEYAGLRFDSARLVRLGAGWRFVGVVHEVLCAPGEPPPSRRVPGCAVVHAGADPERKRRRLYKDLELLREALRASPSDARTQFYLAQTLEDLGMHAQAHEAYARRVGLGGWVEERYEAAYRAARTAHVLGRPWPDVQQLYLAAHAVDPRRAEPLHAVAQRWANAGEPALAWLFASRGAALPFPRDCTMFVQADVYRWRLAELAADAAAALGEFVDAAAWRARAAAGRPAPTRPPPATLPAPPPDPADATTADVPSLVAAV